ncbi:MAG TPA: hypothetical protein VNG29_00540 [Candidatus Paceibacterota bacterium]|nr:hypothetical protein [Candidatus Paceibacterota bacterium]
MSRKRTEKQSKRVAGMTLDKLSLMMGRGFNAVDKRFDAVDKRFDSVDARLSVLESDSKEMKHEMAVLKASIRELTNTLDAFLKRLTDHEGEFELLKREMKFVKKILKEKLHVDLEREMPRSVA